MFKNSEPLPSLLQQNQTPSSPQAHRPSRSISTQGKALLSFSLACKYAESPSIYTFTKTLFYFSQALEMDASIELKLIEKISEIKDKTDDKGNSLLHLVIHFNHTNLIPLFMKAKDNPHKLNRLGLSPYNDAKSRNNQEIVKLFDETFIQNDTPDSILNSSNPCD